MDGIAAVRVALVADGALTALVPAARIQGDALPQGITLPAIQIEHVSGVDRNIPAPGSDRHVTDRIQVTILSKTKVQQQAILRAVRHAAADKFPTVAGITNVTIHTDGTGPDLSNDDASIRIKTQDFRVTYSETR